MIEHIGERRVLLQINSEHVSLLEGMKAKEQEFLTYRLKDEAPLYATTLGVVINVLI